MSRLQRSVIPSGEVSTFFLLFFLVFLQGVSAQIDTLTVGSRVMEKDIKNIVILPEDYDKNKGPYPVLYLLHGATDNFGSWLGKVPRLQEYVDRYNFIVVCPDGGYTSWYYDSPVDPSMRYETYVSQELVQEIDRQYATIPSREGRAITGLSMGGHGAFYLAFKHQDVWGAAGSTSGGLDIRPFPKNWDLPKRLGSYSENKENWEKNTAINMVHLLEGDNLKLIFDCGTDDFFYEGNQRMHQKLLERNIPHDYIERPGGHDNAYWANAIQYQLLFFHNFFEKARNN